MLREGPCRFADVRAALPGVTDRALARALKDLQAAGWVERAVRDDYPPTVTYRPTRPAAKLIPLLQQL